MTRLSTTFADLAHRPALVTFITAGDPTVDHTVASMHAMVEGGADVLELGIPFSDPEAEGPTIQASSERALNNGVTLLRVLEMVAEFRQRDKVTPVVLMGYLNSVLAMHDFAARAGRAGADGLIVSDEEGQAGFTSSTARTAEGAMEVTPVYRCSDLSSALRDFKSRKVFILGTDLKAEESIHDTKVHFPCIVVLGNEGEGLSMKIKKRCDQVVRIPGVNQVQSLNVSVAAGVILADLCHRRNSIK